MPGGPTDPDKILEAIQNGATHDDKDDTLVIADQPAWLRVDGTAWEISEVAGVLISKATFDDLAACTPELPYVRVGGALKRLDSENGYAVLNPA